MINYASRLYFLLGEDKSKLPLLIFYFFFVSIIDLIGIGVIGPYISLVLDQDSSNNPFYKYFNNIKLFDLELSLLTSSSIFIIVIFLIKSIFGIWIFNKIIEFSKNQDIRLRRYLMKAYQSLPYSVYIDRNSSEYIDTTVRLVTNYTKSVLVPLLRTVCDSILISSILLYLMWTNISSLAVLFTFLGILFVMFDKYLLRSLKKHGEESNKASMNMINGIRESMIGFKEIRILRKESFFYTKVDSNSIKFSEKAKKSMFYSIIPRYLIEFFIVTFLVAFIFFIIKNGQEVASIFPSLGIIAVAVIRLMPSFSNASNTLSQLRYNRNSIDILYNDLKNLKSYSEIKRYKAFSII